MRNGMFASRTSKRTEDIEIQETAENLKHLLRNANLARFRSEIGIENGQFLDASAFPHDWRRHARNVGIYEHVVNAERKAARSRKINIWLITACLGLQLLTAAVLTALAAGNGPLTAITVLGALNTVLAGTLAYLKGSNLPGRLKDIQTEWKKIRDYIEHRERAFAWPACQLDVQKEIEHIVQMFDLARRGITRGPAQALQDTAVPQDNNTMDESELDANPMMMYSSSAVKKPLQKPNPSTHSRPSVTPHDGISSEPEGLTTEVASPPRTSIDITKTSGHK